MKYILCSIHDRSVNAYQPVYTVRAEGEAIRNFMDAIASEQSGALHKHPDDFDLYVVGSFNDDSGEITPCQPKKIGDGKQLSTGEA